jgi:hypothetical protein
MKIAGVMMLLAALAAGCGDNQSGPGLDFTLEPPAAVRAFSVDSVHVRVHWDASVNATESSFAGYLLSWGSVTDTLSASVLRFTAGPLPQGLTQFTLRSRRNDGRVSAPLSISWAPAYRFDAVPLVIYEIDDSTSGRPNGIDAGTQSSNPSTFLISPSAQATMDFFLQGHAGQALLLSSANQYSSQWNATLFSTETITSSSLDTARAAFPASTTFSLLNIPVVNNTIYFAQVQGAPGQFNFIRILVRVPAGSFPSRSVEVRLSLQRAPGVPSAALIEVARASPPVVLRT